MKLVLKLSAAFGMLVIMAAAALADQPEPWQMWFQNNGSQMMRDIDWFGRYTFWFITPITIFVMVLLLIVMVRFNARANPTPSRTTHNTLIEVIWTGLPILLLIAIAIPSFNLLNAQLAPEEEPAMTVKATGYQWYWGYEYQDGDELSFDSIMLRDGEAADYGKQDLAQYPRLLAVDNELVVPVGKMVRVLVTAADVIHSFAMPSFGVKVDGVPGRTNETWFKAEREGLFYGQCSELCGRDHAFMPIAIRVVSDAQFEAWKAAAADDLESANAALMASIDSGKNIKLAGN
ncbi:MAG: cytochrome c oxidase subunit II [Phyllobacteriaceae bacterium]|nr:cytochrome c oxidase subunit II [Nitratireductor sp.]MCO5134858.1 cytochrome c oxidase subunit II [Phyllobacteriaceae bacterium]